MTGFRAGRYSPCDPFKDVFQRSALTSNFQDLDAALLQDFSPISVKRIDLFKSKGDPDGSFAYQTH